MITTRAPDGANKLVNNIKAGGTDKKTDVFYFLPELDILSSF